ncbi:MAG: HEAT repeat domain-containing protein [Candidatus Hydrogenedentes bacterium]|nr:HEAT repeat domain-containing protein [Candidatus Hydrogenedentota bacterium]
MFLERFLLSAPVAFAMIAVFSGIAFVALGLGYRRLGVALAINFALTTGVSVVAWFVGAVAGLALAGRGEGAGVAAIVFAFALAGIAAIVTLAAGIGWIVLKRERYLSRGNRSPALIVVGLAFFLVAGASAAMQFVRVTPGLMPNRVLTGQASGLNGPLRAEARDELLARGQDAVPDVIASLQSANQSDLHTFESGLNGAVLYQLEILGSLGGPQSIAELRKWFNSGYAPDIRATAARALGEAGDAESAPAIALLLEERSYEWRKSHFQLLRALTLLKAKDELAHVKSALQFTPDEEGTSFQIGLIGEGIQYLVAMDTPAAWAVVSEVASVGDIHRRETVERVLKDLGRSLPESAGTPTLQQSALQR